MWKIETQSGQSVYPFLLGLCMWGMALAWGYIPAWAKLPTLCSGIVVIALPVGYICVDWMVLLWQVRQRLDAEAVDEPELPAQVAQPLPAITVHEHETTRQMDRVNVGAEALHVLNRGMAMRGEGSLSLPGWRDMRPEYDYGRWSRAVQSLAPYLTPTTGGAGGGGTYVTGGYNNLRELYDAVRDGRVAPQVPMGSGMPALPPSGSGPEGVD